MSNTHDLDLLTKETIKIKIGGKTFELPAEPPVNFTYKLLNLEEKTKKAKKKKDHKAAFDALVDMVADILNLDENNQIERQFIVDKFSNSQMRAIIEIYQKQIVENQNNPN